ncbi:MAG: aminopeptidase N [Sphingomonadales bacterium]
MTIKPGNQTIFLKDYKPSEFKIKSVKLNIFLAENIVEVLAIIRFKHQREKKIPLVLDGSRFLTLKSLKIDGVELGYNKYELKDNSLIIFEVPKEFVLETIVKIKPQDNTTLTGLYKSDGMFCTQCEAEGFRNITYYLDRPDIMSKFQCRIEGNKEKYPVLLSNGNLIESGDLSGGRHYVLWDDPFLKPCYLFALVAGNLSYIEDYFYTQSNRKITLKIYTAQEDINKCDFAMQALKNSMKWDEEVYGLEYDLNIFNIVAVSNFNMGAMENKSLNIFNAKYVLANPKTGTDADFDGIQGVIAHEYFHNWTGNRVTCRDWFQLSLKEGLTVFRDQEFSSDMGSRAQKRIEDVSVLRRHQFPEDDGPMAHPIRPESYIEINNFYTATVYNKGAEVIRMMHEIIGADAFQAGMKLYFKRHDGQAVTCEDFVQSMESASGVNLKQFRLWYSQAGTPLVKIEEVYIKEKQEYVLNFEQILPNIPGQSNKKAMHIPIKVALLTDNGTPLKAISEGDLSYNRDEYVLNIREYSQKFIFKNIPQKPTPSLLRGFSAPIKVDANLTNDNLAFLLAHDTDPFSKWEAGQTLAKVTIFKILEQFNTSKALEIDTCFFQGIEGLLKTDHLDKALLAEALELPSEIYLGQSMEVLDVDGLHKSRNFLQVEFSRRYYDTWLNIYFENLALNSYSLAPEDKAKRKLKNIALKYLMRSGKSEAIEIGYRQFQNSDNMTDYIAAFGGLVNSESDKREIVISKFYNKWKSEPLVIDKWFSIQALSDKKNTINDVINLSKHSAFSFKNPNRLRSLVSVFSLLNQVQFHNDKGRGYKFLTDVILKVDKSNPQISASMMAPLSRWKKLDGNRQKMMILNLERIKSQKGLSKDVLEIVSKSLG